jgi:hypothetical protein
MRLDCSRGLTMIPSSPRLPLRHDVRRTLLTSTGSRLPIRRKESVDMSSQSPTSRVDRLELRMDSLESLPGQVARLESQFLQSRDAVGAQFSALRGEIQAVDENLRAELRTVAEGLRGEIRAGDEGLRDTLRAEIRAGDEETRAQMRVLHEDVIARLALIQEQTAPPPGSRGRPGRPARRKS